MTTLLVTNDFGPRIGGIESFCASVCAMLDNDVVVLTADQKGAEWFDADVGYPVIRLPGPLLPVRSVARRAEGLLHEYGCRSVVFGAAAPLGLMGARMRRAGAHRIIGLTHGHEVWWAKVPGPRRLLRAIGDSVDVLTTISRYTESHIVEALSPAARSKIMRLPPPVDLAAFRPGLAARDPLLCIAASRFVPQKGLGTLLRAWGDVTKELGDVATLRLIGEGPQEAKLRSLASRLPHPHTVEFVGAVPHDELPVHFASAGVFALPVRTLLSGLYAEGLGLAFLEAAASGLPVVVGDSGGAGETVRSGQTGILVDSRRPESVARALATLLSDPVRASEMGRAGRRYVADVHDPARSRRVLRSILGLGDARDEVS